MLDTVETGLKTKCTTVHGPSGIRRRCSIGWCPKADAADSSIEPCCA